ncbi:HPGDS [Branchiostoma lanceolatum]|uniref:glutathione transferase n=1 Tax=Branchiostoma lanceolatum TaxID=7740 RepID=A0A8J9Z3N3_BRALA|nr:HPGDS [Branchiostoma lanceolatum]
MAPKYKLTYFNARARGELVRLIFAAAGVEYEDVRFDYEQWAAFKESTPMGQIPVLEVEGRTMCQSLAIARYVARETGLCGKTSWAEAQVDMFVCGADDLLTKLLNVRFEKDEATKEEGKKGLATYVPNFLANYEKLCGPEGYLVGTSLTYADLAFFEVMHDILKVTTLDKYPKLAKVVENVTTDKGVSAWLAKRPDNPS